MSSETNLMIVDVDGGADDMVALLLILTQPAWTVLAIMCGFGNVNINDSCNNVLRILQFLNQTDIPVYKGLDRSLLGETNYDYEFNGVDGIGGASIYYPLPANKSAIGSSPNMLIELVNNNVGEVTLVALAPLTAIAMAQRLDPTFSGKLKDLIVMGGDVLGFGNIRAAAEFNFYNDPEAAFVVIQEFWSNKSVSSFEACLKNPVPWDWYHEWTSLNTPKAEFIQRVCNSSAHYLEFISQSSGFTSCDLLAMAGAISPEMILSTISKNGVVELKGEYTRGEMVVDWRQPAASEPNIIITDVYNITKYQEMLYNMVI